MEMGLWGWQRQGQVPRGIIGGWLLAEEISRATIWAITVREESDGWRRGLTYLGTLD